MPHARPSIVRRPPAAWVIPAVAASLAVAAFANSVAGDFVWDDRILIVEGRLAKAWGRLGEIFGRDFFYRAELDSAYGYYRPLTTLSYLWDYSWWRLDPVGYHLTNVALHAAAAAGSAWLLLRLGIPSFATAVASALFAVHPIHSESVAWIAGRTDVLAFCFCLVALACELARRGPAWLAATPLQARPWLQAAALGAYLAGLSSKETAIILPAWLFAIDVIAYRRRWRDGLRSIAPYAAVTLAYVVVRFFILGIGGPGRPAEHTPLNVALSLAPTAMRYLGLLALPTQPSAYIINPYVQSLTEPRLWMALAGLAALATGARLVLRRVGWTSPFGLALALLGVAFVPLLNLVRPSGPPDMGAMMAERFCYFPSLPFLLLVGLGADAVLRQRLGAARVAVNGLVLAVVVAGLAGTLQRNQIWRDEATFLQATLEHQPRAVLLWARLAQHHLARQELEPAAAAIAQAKAVDPDGSALLSAEALLYHLRGEPERALPLQERFVRLAGRGGAAARNNLAYLYRTNGRSEDARRLLLSLIEQGSGYGDVYANLAAIYRSDGDVAQARHYYRAALEDRPDDLQIAGALASLEVEAGRSAAAIALYERLCSFHPGNPRIENNLAMLHAQAGQDERAAEILAGITERHPEYGSARVNYAQVLYRLGRRRAALQQLEAAAPLVRGGELEAVVARQQRTWRE